MCGYVFTATETTPQKKRPAQNGSGQGMQVTINLPVILGLIILLVSMNIMVVLGLQNRKQTLLQVAAEQTTATFIATTYVSPTPSPTATRTPAPPTATIEPEIEYTVISGDSCLSIVTKFKISYDSLVSKNKQLDCSLLKIGTVLIIPHPTATPEPTNTKVAAQ